MQLTKVILYEGTVCWQMQLEYIDGPKTRIPPSMPLPWKVAETDLGTVIARLRTTYPQAKFYERMVEDNRIVTKEFVEVKEIGATKNVWSEIRRWFAGRPRTKEIGPKNVILQEKGGFWQATLELDDDTKSPVMPLPWKVAETDLGTVIAHLRTIYPQAKFYERMVEDNISVSYPVS
jgi:hypothetical protein